MANYIKSHSVFLWGGARNAKKETTDNCKMTDKSKCASIRYLTVYGVIVRLIKF